MKAPKSDLAKEILKKGDFGQNVVEKLNTSKSKSLKIKIGNKKYILKQIGL